MLNQASSSPQVSGVKLRSAIEQRGLAWISLTVFLSITAAFGQNRIQKAETFNSAASAASRGWVELGCRSNSQNYGFSNTANSGGPAGEAGGTMTRRAIRSTYCDVFGGPLTLTNFITAKGKFVLTNTPASGNASMLYGHGDSAQAGLNSEASQMGLVLATSPPRFFAHITFANGSASRFETVFDSGVLLNQVYDWGYTYDPVGNGGNGSLTVHASAAGSGVTNTGVLNLSAAQRALGASFNSFGIIQRGLSDLTPAPACSSFIDNVEYTAVTTAPIVQFASSSSSGLETVTTALVNVALSSVQTQAVTVQFSASSGTASNGLDYVLVPDTLTFNPGETNKAISIQIINDGVEEADETIIVALTNATGDAQLGANATHTYTILNPPPALKLNIARWGDDILVTWPAVFGQYQLQSCMNLSNPPVWADVTNAVTVTNFLRQVVVARSRERSFFRLAQTMPFTNSIGLRMVPIPAGAFTMGYWQSTPLDSSIVNVSNWVPSNGDYDEKLAHQVTITQPFHMSAFEVSNSQYEQFDPSHYALRGQLGFSTSDSEAVVFVSWDEAKAFCDWLSAREGRPYRTPTEAEWEYACRAGITTHFSIGDTLPSEYIKNPGFSWYPASGSATTVFIGTTPPNPWGLYDMHGNVEEWCHDWYGPYEEGPQTDPVGRTNGLVRVTRGGSHSTVAFYARSENRMGTLPDDKSFYIGFRVVLGAIPTTPPLPEVAPAPYQTNVSQTVPAGITNGPNSNVPYFNGPWKYVNIPANSYGPVYSGHNHDAGGIVECPNGDLLAIWYTCVTESGRELAMAASRLRYGQTNWEVASSFFDVPDRNDHAPCFWFDGDQTLYHFNGLSAAATWGPLAIMIRTSTNNGVTWSRPRIIAPDHTIKQQPIASCIKTVSGAIIFTSDAGTGGSGGSVPWKSLDGGLSWYSPATGRPAPSFTDGATGAWPAGLHCPIAQMSDGRLITFGRGNNINNMMPKSLSSDEGTNWTYSASMFPGIGGGQRATMLRLKEGPLFFASFGTSMTITDASGGTRTVAGLFAALSYDDGATWPYIRLISDDGSGRSVETTDGSTFTMSLSNAEPRGYMASTQARNGILHLITSRQHYQFNLKWLATRPPAP